MENDKTLTVKVTEIPESVIRTIQAEAVRNGVSPNSVAAAIRWTLAQYANGLRRRLNSGPRKDLSNDEYHKRLATATGTVPRERQGSGNVS